MSSTQVRSETAIETPRARTVDMKLEVVVIPVSDVDRAKEFYGSLGWRLDADFADGDDWRVIQFTPPGSGCSVIFGKNVTGGGTRLRPGTVPHRLRHRGRPRRAARVAASRISEVFHDAGDVHAGADEPYLFGRLRVSGPDPERRSYRSFASFSDPDGNGWLLQEVTVRLPGRVDADTTFASSTELAAALRRAEAAHGEHEKRTGQRDADWPDWYAEYMVAEQAGKELPIINSGYDVIVIGGGSPAAAPDRWRPEIVGSCTRSKGANSMRYRDLTQGVFCGEASSTAVTVPSCSLRSRTQRAAFAAVAFGHP